MAEKRPAYQRYPKDYLSDENVALMSLEQEGAYNRLMDYCWLQGSIPSDTASLARLCRVSEQDMERIWPGVEKCFRLGGGRYTHPRLDIERRKQDAHRKAKSDAGRAGAKAKHDKEKSGSAMVLPVAESSFAVCSLQFASAVEEVTERQALLGSAREPEPSPTTAGHPDLAAWLGPHAGCLDGLDRIHQAAWWGLWGPTGTRLGDWHGMDPRPDILASAIIAWKTTKPRNVYQPLCAKILARAVDDAIASDREASQRDSERGVANDLRERALAREREEIERLNAEAAAAAAKPDPPPPRPPSVRGSGLTRISA